MKTTIPAKKRKQLFDKLKKANTSFQKKYPGDRPDRQPVHTVYGGANLFKADAARALAARSLEIFTTYAPDFISFGRIFSLEGIEKIDALQDIGMLKNSYESL